MRRRRGVPDSGCAAGVLAAFGLYVLAALVVAGLLFLIDAAFR